jgi:4-hydroxybenzoate polyprenyltransferase
MVDRADDLKIGIKTSAITFGRFDVLMVMVCYAGFIGLMAYLGYISQLAWPYFACLLAASCVAIYHFFLIKNREPAQCFKAFLHNNWLGALVCLGVVAALLV